MKISIITVTYNSQKYIKDCIQSIKLQKQHYNNIEHIIIDGGSTDGTLSIIENNSYQPNILISENDNGIYDAMNKGINLSTGDVIGFLNSDDFYANNNVLAKIGYIFANNFAIDACYADLIYVSPDDISNNVRYWKSKKFVPGSFSKGWCPPHPTFFVRRSIYEKYGKFNLDYHYSSDTELMMRFLENYKIKINYLPEVWVKMRLGGVTNKNIKNILLQNLEILNALKKNKLSANPIKFFFYKILLRTPQFFQRANT